MEDFNLSTVNRVEVIDQNGRSYVKYLSRGEQISIDFQDNNQTMKLFIIMKKETKLISDDDINDAWDNVYGHFNEIVSKRNMLAKALSNFENGLKSGPKMEKICEELLLLSNGVVTPKGKEFLTDHYTTKI
jgi:hypothetical protein